MDLTKRIDTKISIYGYQDMVTCPGRTRTNTGREGAPGTYVDGDPVNMRLSLLMIGDIAFTGINAEIYNLIGQRVKQSLLSAKPSLQPPPMVRQIQDTFPAMMPLYGIHSRY